MTQKILAERLAKARNKKGYTQNQIADFLECNRATVTNYENGKRTPDVDTIVKLSKLYEVSADYLLGLTDVKSSNKDINFICDYTHLNEQSVHVLHQYGTENIYKLLNCFLNGKAVWDFRELALLFSECETEHIEYNNFMANFLLNYDELLSSRKKLLKFLEEEKNHKKSIYATKFEIQNIVTELFNKYAQDVIEYNKICSDKYKEVWSSLMSFTADLDNISNDSEVSDNGNDTKA